MSHEPSVPAAAVRVVGPVHAFFSRIGGKIMTYRHLVLIGLMCGAPGVAVAQFTTFIPPQNKVVDSVKAVVVAQQVAHSDSIVNTQLTNIKTWVDSAAGTMGVPTSMADTTAASTAVAVRSDSVTMVNGRRAPATASALPLIALLGAVTLGVGLLLVSGRPEPARSHPRA
jgi:hypothetical protein